MPMSEDEKRQELLRKLGVDLDPPMDSAALNEARERNRKASDAQAHQAAIERLSRPRPKRWR